MAEETTASSAGNAERPGVRDGRASFGTASPDLRLTPSIRGRSHVCLRYCAFVFAAVFYIPGIIPQNTENDANFPLMKCRILVDYPLPTPSPLFRARECSRGFAYPEKKSVAQPGEHRLHVVPQWCGGSPEDNVRTKVGPRTNPGKVVLRYIWCLYSAVPHHPGMFGELCGLQLP